MTETQRKATYAYFPSFSEGLSLRGAGRAHAAVCKAYFPSFSEGLSLRGCLNPVVLLVVLDFPSFSEGLSLRGGGGVVSTRRR